MNKLCNVFKNSTCFILFFCRVPDDCPRLLINRELVGTVEESNFIGLLEKLGVNSDFDLGTAPHMFAKGMNFKSERNRDIAVLGDCDDGVRKLAKALGWEEEFNKLCEQGGSGAGAQADAQGASSLS